MRNVLVPVFMAVAAPLLFAQQAHAICPGAADSTALLTFTNDPSSWVKAHGQDADVGAQLAALAAAATNVGDKKFGAALSSALGRLSADQGAAAGKALGRLGSSCFDTLDPNDIADKKYISANIAPAMTGNSGANTAYGESTGPQTASTGGGAGGGGAGVGGQTGGAPSGGAFQGLPSTPTGGVNTPGYGLPPINPIGSVIVP